MSWVYKRRNRLLNPQILWPNWNCAAKTLIPINLHPPTRHAHSYNHILANSCHFIHSMRNSPSSSPDHATFRILFKHYASASARLLQEKLGHFNFKDQTSFCNLIHALCDNQHVHEAQELVLGQHGNIKFDVNATILNILLRGWFKLEQWGKCRELWEEMERRGVQKNLRSYAIFMDILCKSGKPERAVKLFKQMQSKRMKLDVVAYNIAIRATGLSQGVDSSIELFREMGYSGLEPTVVTYNTLIKLLCDHNRYEEALGILAAMRKNGCRPNAVSYQFLFECMKKPGEILGLFDTMIERGDRPSMATYVMLIRKFGEWGFLRPVFVVWKKMEGLGCRPDASAYIAMIDALVKKGLMDVAKKYDEEMVAKGLSSSLRIEVGT